MFNWIPALRWFHGLLAAIIGGGAGAVSAAIAASTQAPGQFNLSDPNAAWSLLKVAAATFVINGVISASFYLSKSPLPNWDGTDRRGQ